MTDFARRTLDALAEVAARLGHTPVVSLGDGIFGKDEGKNPAGSVKDRAAFYIVRDAVASGALAEGAPVVEATSGNTGIGLAYICGLVGIRVVLTMPESMSAERRKMLADYGALPGGKSHIGGVSIGALHHDLRGCVPRYGIEEFILRFGIEHLRSLVRCIVVAAQCKQIAHLLIESLFRGPYIPNAIQ